jgi:hypothetical protein
MLDTSSVMAVVWGQDLRSMRGMLALNAGLVVLGREPVLVIIGVQHSNLRAFS